MAPVSGACVMDISEFNPWGALQRGPGGPWPSQNFGWVGHNAFGPTNNWSVCSLILHCGQLILRKISKIGATMQMSDFKAKMHQIYFLLGLGSLQCPQPPASI